VDISCTTFDQSYPYIFNTAMTTLFVGIWNSLLQPMVQQPVSSGAQGMMVAPVGRPGAGGPQQPGSGPMNPNQPGQSTCHFHFIIFPAYCKVTHFSHVICFERCCSWYRNLYSSCLQLWSSMVPHYQRFEALNWLIFLSVNYYSKFINKCTISELNGKESALKHLQ
jgi:hypothetical protein